LIWVYRALMTLVQLLLKVLSPFLNKKLQYFYKNQGQIYKKSNNSLSPLWIHASSGEIEYAIPLIEELTKKYPQMPLLVTHSSLSSKKSLDHLKVDMTGVIPLDSYFSVSHFLSQVNPKALLISRTEVWPELIHQLHQRHIPSFLFSATFAPGSKKNGMAFAPFYLDFTYKINKNFCRE
jgi:3-deoxy-D-manno-octulosonic-acid transferase